MSKQAKGGKAVAKKADSSDEEESSSEVVTPQLSF